MSEFKRLRDVLILSLFKFVELDLGDVATEVPVKVKITTLKKVVEWMEHSK